VGIKIPPNYSAENEKVIQTFSKRLEDYATSLSDRECQILLNLIMNVMDPLDRIRWKDPASLLNKDEQEYLDELQQ
jgi:hypothetical protein